MTLFVGAAVLIGLLVIHGLGATQPRAATRCGEERWAVKTLSDKREHLVKFKPKDTTVNRLRKEPSPGVGSDTPRIKGVETTNWRIKVDLVEMKLEDDHDIILWSPPPASPPGRSSLNSQTRLATAQRAPLRKRRWRGLGAR
jgi:hypothetical protein